VISFFGMPHRTALRFMAWNFTFDDFVFKIDAGGNLRPPTGIGPLLSPRRQGESTTSL
jgi:hypothetical protein